MTDTNDVVITDDIDTPAVLFGAARHAADIQARAEQNARFAAALRASLIASGAIVPRELAERGEITPSRNVVCTPVLVLDKVASDVGGLRAAHSAQRAARAVLRIDAAGNGSAARSVAGEIDDNAVMHGPPRRAGWQTDKPRPRHPSRVARLSHEQATAGEERD